MKPADFIKKYKPLLPGHVLDSSQSQLEQAMTMATIIYTLATNAEVPSLGEPAKKIKTGQLMAFFSFQKNLHFQKFEYNNRAMSKTETKWKWEMTFSMSEEKHNTDITEKMPIGAYMDLHLKTIEPYYGECTRFHQLKDGEYDQLTVGRIFVFPSALSTKRGSRAPEMGAFNNRNTVLHFWSQTGRHIKHLQTSDYLKDKEDEVLFPPCTMFLVMAKWQEAGGQSTKNHVMLREVVVGSTEEVVYWVDDNALPLAGGSNETQSLMKRFIKSEQNDFLYRDFEFIFKQSTEMALTFFQSPLQPRLEKFNEGFLIISDMTRGTDGAAGVKLMCALRDSTSSVVINCAKIIYTGNLAHAKSMLESKGFTVNTGATVSKGNTTINVAVNPSVLDKWVHTALRK